MSAPEKLIGAGAAIMALCCALLPLGGGPFAGAGTIGVIVGAAVLAAVVYSAARRRKSGGRC